MGECDGPNAGTWTALAGLGIATIGVVSMIFAPNPASAYAIIAGIAMIAAGIGVYNAIAESCKTLKTIENAIACAVGASGSFETVYKVYGDTSTPEALKEMMRSVDAPLRWWLLMKWYGSGQFSGGRCGEIVNFRRNVHIEFRSCPTGDLVSDHNGPVGFDYTFDGDTVALDAFYSQQRALCENPITNWILQLIAWFYNAFAEIAKWFAENWWIGIVLLVLLILGVVAGAWFLPKWRTVFGKLGGD